MQFLVIVSLVALLFLGTACRKKSETLQSEISQAGYQMTVEGWMDAIQRGDSAVLSKMVEAGFDAKSVDEDGNSGLHFAATADQEEIGNFLLNRGLGVDIQNKYGRTPLMSSVLAGKPKLTRWLLKQGADPSIKDAEGYIALMLAVSEGNTSAVEELSPYHRDELDSALLLAAIAGETKVIDTLTNYGASVYTQMDDGRTALMLAAQNGHQEAVELLIDIGASRFSMTEAGDTAQTLASAAGHDEIAEFIVSGVSRVAVSLDSEETIAEAFLTDEMEPEGDQPNEMASAEVGNEESASAEDTSNTRLFPQGDERAEVSQQLPTGQFDQAATNGAEPAEGNPRPRRVAGNEMAIRSLQDASLQVRTRQQASVAGPSGNADTEIAERATTKDTMEPNLVMRQYRQRELPLQVRQVSGGSAQIQFFGNEDQEVQLSAGDPIPNTTLNVVRVYNRMESGKANDGAPFRGGGCCSGRPTKWKPSGVDQRAACIWS